MQAPVTKDSDDLLFVEWFLAHRLKKHPRKLQFCFSEKNGTISNRQFSDYIRHFHADKALLIDAVDNFTPSNHKATFVYIGPGKYENVKQALGQCGMAVYTTPESGVNCPDPETLQLIQSEFENGIHVEPAFCDDAEERFQSFLDLAAACLSNPQKKVHIVFNPEFHTAKMCTQDLASCQSHVKQAQQKNNTRNMFSNALCLLGPDKFDLAPRIDYSNVTALCSGKTVQDVCGILKIASTEPKDKIIDEALLCTRFLFFPFSYSWWIKDTYLCCLRILKNLASVLVPSVSQKELISRIQWSICSAHRGQKIDLEQIITCFSKEAVSNGARVKWEKVSKGRISADDPSQLAGVACDWAVLKFCFKAHVFSEAFTELAVPGNPMDICTVGSGQMPGDQTGYIDYSNEEVADRLDQIIIEKADHLTPNSIVYDWNTGWIGTMITDALGALLASKDESIKILQETGTVFPNTATKLKLLLDPSMFYKDPSLNFWLICNTPALISVMDKFQPSELNIITDMGTIEVPKKHGWCATN